MKIIIKKVLITIIGLNLAISCQEGCLDPNALNYNSSAKKSNNELCEYDTDNKESLFIEIQHKSGQAAFYKAQRNSASISKKCTKN